MSVGTADTARRERGNQQFTEVMTDDPPTDGSPVSIGQLDFVLAEIWSRPGLSRRDRRFITLACVADADAPGPLDEHVYA